MHIVACLAPKSFATLSITAIQQTEKDKNRLSWASHLAEIELADDFATWISLLLPTHSQAQWRPAHGETAALIYRGVMHGVVRLGKEWLW